MGTALVPQIYDPTVADEDRVVSTDAAEEMVRRLAQEEGLLVGPSSGAALACALEVAREVQEGVVVTLFPDSAYKYSADRCGRSSYAEDRAGGPGCHPDARGGRLPAGDLWVPDRHLGGGHPRRPGGLARPQRLGGRSGAARADVRGPRGGRGRGQRGRLGIRL